MRTCVLALLVLLSLARPCRAESSPAPESRAALLLEEALREVSVGDVPEAERALDEAATLFGSSGLPASARARSQCVAVLDLHASIFAARGDLARAEALHRSALRVAEAGGSMIDVADSLVLLSGVLLDRGDRGGAERAGRRALKLWEKAGRGDDPEVARPLNALSDVLVARGELPEADALLRRASRVAEAPGASAAMQAAVAARRGVVRLAMGRLPDAEAMLERSLDLAESALGPDHVALAQIQQALADCYRLRNRPRDAQRLYESAMERIERAYGPSHPALLPVVAGLAMVLERQDEVPQAATQYRRAVQIAGAGPRQETYLALQLGFESRHRDGMRASSATARRP